MEVKDMEITAAQTAAVEDVKPEMPAAAKKPVNKRTVLIGLSTLLLVAAIGLVLLLIPRGMKAGRLSIRVGEVSTVIRGQDTLSRFQSSIRNMDAMTPEQASQSQLTCFSSEYGLSVELNGRLYGEQRVQVYDRSLNLISDKNALSIPAEQGDYLVRFDILWGEADNYVNTIYYIRLNVA